MARGDDFLIRRIEGGPFDQVRFRTIRRGPIIGDIFETGLRGRSRAAAERERASRARRAAAAERTARSALFRRIARLGGFGAAVAGIAADIAAEVERLQRERIDEELRAANEQLERKLQRRAKEKVLRTTGVRRASGRPDSPAQLGDRSPLERVRVSVEPPPSRVVVQPGIPEPPDVIGGAPEPAPIPAPRIPAPGTTPGPGETPLEQPAGTPKGLQTGGFPAPRSPNVAIPSPSPAPTTIPGFGVPAPLPAPSPTFGIFSPPSGSPGFNFPPGTPGLPAPAPAPRLASPLTDFETGVLQLPQPVPQPQQQPQRCRPCPEDTPPRPRTKCMKGMYVEGRMDNQVKFIPWAEVNCETGRETGGVGSFDDPGLENVISILEAIG